MNGMLGLRNDIHSAVMAVARFAQIGLLIIVRAALAATRQSGDTDRSQGSSYYRC